ncbi:PepSY domain-containing protein [Actinophytocola sp.]|uniref:PepSY domain-containing protein n=1 Tax=Actinophytocola sp. TaxID=1872138 RepID=UPI0038998190
MPAPGSGELSADDASRIVTDRVGGTVREVEREVEHGRAEWKVEVTTADGNTYDVRVDARTGAVIRVGQAARDGQGADDHGSQVSDDHGDDHSDDHGGRGDDRGGHDDDDHGSHGEHGGDDH